ncbi:MAG: divergent polysaccharide deacetylase family protein [Deltaproteobacteria bacterium]|nr:divergent polysaccharide deacetylase family protein [Deltaproteobacteria bacterium]
MRDLLGPLDVAGTRVAVRDLPDALQIRDRLKTLAEHDPARFELVSQTEGAGSLLLTLRLDSEIYPVDLRWGPASRPEPPAAPSGARVSVVIDDMGRDLAEARAFLDLEVVVTAAVIPYLAHSVDVAHLARERGREFLVHVPMEPQGYPKVDPGRGALLAAMSEADVRAALGGALSAVPGASGVNNHMGSRLTELRRPMAWVMDELRSRGLFFLDSATSAKSVAGDVAREAGLGWAKRDVFLDNAQTVEAVGKQLELTLQKALRSGSAIAIGHPHPTTLQALKLWAPKLQQAGVRTVPLAQLVRQPSG